MQNSPITRDGREALLVDDDDDVIDIRAIFRTLWLGKWTIIICGLFGVVFGYLAASQIDPKYRATAKLLLDTQQADVMQGDGVLQAARFGSTTLQTHTEILQSTQLINRVIEKLNLAEAREFQPKPIEERSLTDQAKAWIQQQVAVPVEINDFLIDVGLRPAPRAPLPPDVAAERKRLGLVRQIESGMSLKPILDSRVIEVSFTSGSPRLSAQVVNEITNQYLIDQLEGKLETTRNAVGWLTTRVADLQVQVSDAERAVEDAYAALSEDAGQSLDVTQQQIKSLTGALSVQRNELSVKQAQFLRLSQAVEEGRDLGALTEFRESEIVSAFRSQESELLAQRTTLSETVSEGHPALVRLNAQIEGVRDNITAEANRILQSIEVDLEALRFAEAELVTEIRDLENKAADQSRAALEIRQLEREAEASRILYQNLLSRLQESTQEESLQTADARVISPAEVPASPLGTSARRTQFVYAILGVFAGIGIVVLFDRLNNTFRSPQQLEQMTGLTVLGTVPLVGSRMKRADVMSQLRNKPNSAMAESVRNLRTSLLYSNVDNPPKVVMFTSSVPREGKSTTSMLISLTSQQMGRSAIIVDCDLRKPTLSKVLNVKDNETGLLSVINQTATLEEAIYTEPDSGLHVLMTKATERNASINAADVLSSRRFKDLVAELSQKYDLVVLDTPPTLVVTDARIVSAMSDAVVFAVRWDKTPRSAVLEGIKELASVDAKVSGIVMTMVNEARAVKYAYDGYHYYKGKYRDYYQS
ncbi:MAG: GumC family protein [Hyphomicrobiales bacterium]